MTPDALKRVSALWDALDGLPADDRGPWLAALPSEDAVYAPVLQAMWRRAHAPGDGLSRGSPAMDDTPNADAAHATGDLIGPYRLARLLGHGGMGEVWLARRDDGLLDRDVAIKLPLLLTNQATLRRRFERERNILASLTHPHIARLYDAGVSADGQPYMALEYVEGEPITAHCDRRRLPVADRIGLFLQVLGAVQFAHTRLVVHRDLKPSNILVTAQGEVRLLDFGIAKLLDDEATGAANGPRDATALTRLGGQALTLDYASPEQILQQPVSTLSDVYSLGVLLYELLCGERPCRWAQTIRGLLEAAVLAAPRPLPSSRVVDTAAALRGTTARTLIRELRGDLDTIALKALKPLTADRYATADALGEDLRRWRDGEAVLARPDSRGYRAWRFVGRNRLAVTSGALVVAGLSAGLAVALWQAQVARTEAQTAKATEAFLTGLFESNTPEQDDPVKAQQTTARELLDRGSRRVVDSLNDAPEAKLRLLKTLAFLNRGLALDDTRFLVQRQRLTLFANLYPAPSQALAREYIDAAEAAQASVSAVSQAPALLKQAQYLLDASGDLSSFERGRIELLEGNLADGDNCAALPYALRGVAILRRFAVSAELVDGLLLQSQTQTYCGDPSAALQAAEESTRLLQALHQKRGLADAYKMIAQAQMALGRMGLSFAAGRRALFEAESLHPVGATPGSDVMNALASLSIGLVACAQPADALAVIEPRLRAALADVTHSDPDAIVSVLIQKSNALVALGTPAEAARALDEANTLMRTFDVEDAQRVMYLDARTLVLLEEGRLDETGRELAQAAVLHRRLHHAASTQINGYTSARIHYALQTGDADAATDGLSAFFPRPLASGQVSRSQLEKRLLESEILASKHQWQLAAATAESVLSEIGGHPEPRFVRDQKARAALVLASALQALGRLAEATSQRQIAADVFKAMKNASPLGT